MRVTALSTVITGFFAIHHLSAVANFVRFSQFQAIFCPFLTNFRTKYPLRLRGSTNIPLSNQHRVAAAPRCSRGAAAEREAEVRKAPCLPLPPQ